MAVNDCFPEHEQIKVNKTHRYACLRKLMKFEVDVTSLFEKEQKRDFSDADHFAELRHSASQLSDESKEAIFKSYITKDKLKQ